VDLTHHLSRSIAVNAVFFEGLEHQAEPYAVAARPFRKVRFTVFRFTVIRFTVIRFESSHLAKLSLRRKGHFQAFWPSSQAP
jgi:hypothetical protein